jgi:pimeloyl-ACP methyl ester carboxylesterase
MAETIVMIHGMWVNGSYWEHVKTYFEGRGYRCLAPTLRHHDRPPGEPPHPDLGRTSLLDYAADLEAELRRLEAPPILMGHSMGGLLAQLLAARGLARAAVLLTPASPAGIVAIRVSVLRSFLSGMLRWGFWRNPYRQTYGEAVYSMLHLLPAEARRRIYEGMGYESGRAACEIGFWPLDPRRAARVDAAAVNCPLLVTGASQDRITPVPIVRKVASRYGALATYREFPDHAHSLLHEQGWEEVAQACASWLEQVLRPA